MIPRHCTAPRGKLPAYAHPLAELRRQGQRPANETVIIRIDSWPPGVTETRDGMSNRFWFTSGRPAQVWCPQVVVTEGDDPGALDFSFARDLDAIIPHWRSKSPPSRLRALLRRVLQADPRRLIVLDMECNSRTWFIKSVDRGVEVQL
ncbi:hypothetical protein FG147_11465 [Thauera sp. UPWRP]|nr:hypothetical protein FG147_11465 [Thauera sp. UPWRP]